MFFHLIAISGHVECGSSTLKPPIQEKLDNRIYQGTDVTQQEIPWHAVVQIKYGHLMEDHLWCSGVIVSPYHVLTAAHCLFRRLDEERDILQESILIEKEKPPTTVQQIAIERMDGTLKVLNKVISSPTQAVYVKVPSNK